MIVLAVLLALTVAAFLWARDRADTRAQKERAALLNRIQHPQVYEPSVKVEATGAHHLPWDDSEAWKEFVDGSSSS